jgi:hypothetical protein
MMRTSARLVCLFTILVAPAAAQSTTEDGIRAMLRGDYQAAARILRPLAEDAARPDPVARFFLAFLIEQRDNSECCGSNGEGDRANHPDGARWRNAGISCTSHVARRT